MRDIRASDIGSCSFCPYQLYLRRQYGDSKQTKKQLQSGDKAHSQYNKTYRTGSGIRITLMLVLLVVIWLILK